MNLWEMSGGDYCLFDLNNWIDEDRASLIAQMISNLPTMCRSGFNP